jgi:hypothetical protein
MPNEDQTAEENARLCGTTGLEIEQIGQRLVQAMLELFEVMGHAPLNRYSGAIGIQVDENWHVAANGHALSKEYQPPKGMKARILPFHFAVWWEGWLAGMLFTDGTALDGNIAAGEAANIETLTEALEGRLKIEKQKRGHLGDGD